jgi:hypothetical protein
VVAEQLPHDISRILRSAHRGYLRVRIDVIHLKRVGDQINRAACLRLYGIRRRRSWRHVACERLLAQPPRRRHNDA